MNREWPKLGNAGFPPQGGFGEPDVLIEYDGPRLVLYSGGGEPRHLAIAADWNATESRWLFSDVSRMEVEALALGGLPMRDAFSRKEKLLVVDFDHDEAPQRTWQIDVTKVPGGILPVPDSSLPDYVREHLIEALAIEESTLSRVRFSGKPVVGSRIGFTSLWQAVHVFQSMWTAIGESVGLRSDAREKPTELMAGPFVHGSFGIAFVPSNIDAFGRVIVEYRDLLRDAHHNPKGLAERLQEHGGLRRQLQEYVDTLEALELDAFVDTPSSRVFLGFRSAPAVTRALRTPARARSDADAGTGKRMREQKRGYFVDFNIEKEKFAFHDLDSKSTLHGSLAATITRQVSREDLEATVGKKTHYRITISMPKTGEPKLFDLEMLGQLPLGTDAPRRRKK